MYITLSEVKRHLNIDATFTDDDGYLLSLIDVAERATALRLNRRLETCVGRDGVFDPSVRHSVLLLIGTYYSQREATTPQQVTQVPLGFEYLADLNRRYTIK